MPTQWRYGSLTVLFVQSIQHRRGIAILTDAARSQVLMTWDEANPLWGGTSGSPLFAAQDLAGEQGWIVGPPTWLSTGEARKTDDPTLPEWITAAIEEYHGPDWTLAGRGLTLYQLRRPAS